LYLNSNEKAGSVKVHVYPVPNLKNPFLGVHFTLTVDGQIKIGPTAIPAFWREQYKGLDNFELTELLEIVRRQVGLLAFSGLDFMSLALSEVRKYSKAFMVKEASRMLHGVRIDQYQSWGKPGIRAQLLDLKEQKLEMDFVIEGDSQSMHVLNAVSPAFTCSLPFSSYVCDKIQVALQ
jgi:L-2-hydroxyglutarate oxidase LhgO